MGLILQSSRLQHHTLTATGSTFSVPSIEDFTVQGAWTIYDLALSEIGVSESDEKAYMRIGSTIKEFEWVGTTASIQDFESVLSTGNTTGTYSIILDSKLADNSDTTNLFLTSMGIDIWAQEKSWRNPNNTYSDPIYSTTIDTFTNDGSTITFYSVLNSNFAADTGTIWAKVVSSGIGKTNSNAFVGEYTAGYKFIGNTMSAIGTGKINDANLSDYTTAGIDVNTDGTNLYFTLKGEAGTDINWTSKIEYQIIYF